MSLWNLSETIHIVGNAVHVGGQHYFMVQSDLCRMDQNNDSKTGKVKVRTRLKCRYRAADLTAWRDSTQVLKGEMLGISKAPSVAILNRNMLYFAIGWLLQYCH